MTRICMWFLAIMAVLGGATGWAADKKASVPELLPPPQPCCEESNCLAPECCKTGCCPGCGVAHEKTRMETKVFNVDQLLAADQADRESIAAVIKLISEYVQPSTWSCAGGSGNIEYYALGRALVINQSADVQEQIAKLLPLVHQLQQCACKPAC